MGEAVQMTRQITEAAYRFLDGKLSQNEFDELVKSYENDTYSRMEYKTISVTDIRVLIEQRRRNEINDSTWILGILGYKKAITSNPNSPYRLPEIKPNDTTLVGPQQVATLYKTGEIPLHTASSYMNEYRASWEASLPSNLVPDPTRTLKDVERALNGFKDGTISYSKMLVELKAFITPNTTLIEVEEDPTTTPIFTVGDKVKLTEDGKRDYGRNLSELDKYYTVVGGDLVEPNLKEIEEIEESNAGIMLLADGPDESYGGVAPVDNSPSTTGQKDPAFNGSQVGISDSAGNTAAVPASAVENTVQDQVVNRTISVSGDLNVADLPITRTVDFAKGLNATASEVRAGNATISDLVNQYRNDLYTHTVASVEEGSFKGQIDYSSNTRYSAAGEESGIQTGGYTTLPDAETWTRGVKAEGVLNISIGNTPVKVFNGGDFSQIDYSSYTYADLVAAAQRFHQKDPSVNLTMLVQMARALQANGELFASQRLQSQNLIDPKTVNTPVPVTSPSSVHDQNMEGGTSAAAQTTSTSTGNSSNGPAGTILYKPDEEKLVMGNIRYYPIYKVDPDFNYVGNSGRQGYNRKVMLNEDANQIQNAYRYPFEPGTRDSNQDDTAYNKRTHRHEYKDFNLNGERYYDNMMSKKWEYMTQPTLDIKANFKHQQSRDERPSVFNGSFIQNMTNVRAALGIPVHGDNDLAVAMKYFMYNRFRTPDSNLAFNKSAPYIFFTRPDLNLLCASGKELTLRPQLMNNAEVTILYRQRPEMFKLLMDRERCGDKDNFNYLLSNQVMEMHTSDEEIELQEAGKSWGGYSMPYGGVFTGRNSGKLEITFNETQYGDVTKFLKLWMIYIDNVSRGVWSPSYNLYNVGSDSANLGNGYNQINGNIYDSRGNKVTDKSLFAGNDGVSTEYENSHVYTRTIDYAASIYTFRVGPDGDEVIYWTKYYGVFPINGGNSALGSFNGNSDISSALPITATFSYAWKKDMSPMSLVEFNKCANVTSDGGDVDWEWVFNPLTQRAGRPFVTKPFIYFDSTSNVTIPGNNEAMLGKKRMRISLKFQNKPNTRTMSDNILYSSIV